VTDDEKFHGVRQLKYEIEINLESESNCERRNF